MLGRRDRPDPARDRDPADVGDRRRLGGAPAEYLRLAGEPLTTAARVVAERIGAELVTVPGFYPQVQQPDAVKDALATLWAQAP